MIELTALAVIGVTLFVVFAACFALMMVVKAVLWVILLPFRFLFGLLFLPLLLLKLVFGAVLFVLTAPFVLLAALIGLLAAAVALAIPFLPLFFVAFVVWLLVRSTRTAAA